MLQMETTIESSLVSLNHLQRVQSLLTSGIWMLIWWPLMATRAQVSPRTRFVIVVSQNSKNAQLCPQKSVTNICYNILGASLQAAGCLLFLVTCPLSTITTRVQAATCPGQHHPMPMCKQSDCPYYVPLMEYYGQIWKWPTHVKQLKIIKSAGGSRAQEAGQSQGQAEQNKASSHLSVNQFSCSSREGDGGHWANFWSMSSNGRQIRLNAASL